MGSSTHTHGESMAGPPNSSPRTPIPVASSSAATTWRSIARSTSVAKSSPFLGTAESARWPARNGTVAVSRIADASATNASRSIAGLLSHRGQRLRQGEPTGVEGLAHDGALDAAAGESGNRAQVVQAGHAARRDHRGFGAIGDTSQQVKIRATQGAVLADIGDDEPRTSLAVKAFQHVPQVAAIGLPAAPAQPVFAAWIALVDLHVQADGDLVPVLGDHPSAPLRVFQGGRSEVDPGAAGGQRRGQRIVVADPAGHLDPHVELADDLGEQFAVGAAAERGVQVDQVDPFGTVALPAQRGGHRRAVLGFAAGFALYQAHGTAVDHVDRGQQDQRHLYNPSTQLLSTAAPASPLFSGWNWVAANGPSSTAAKNPTWCVAHVSNASGEPSQCCAAYECTK